MNSLGCWRGQWQTFANSLSNEIATCILVRLNDAISSLQQSDRPALQLFSRNGTNTPHASPKCVFSSKIGTMPNGPSLLSVLHFVCCSRAGGYGHSAGNCMSSIGFLNSHENVRVRYCTCSSAAESCPRARDAWARKQPRAKNQQRMGKKKEKDETVTPETAQSPPGCRISTNITSLV